MAAIEGFHCIHIPLVSGVYKYVAFNTGSNMNFCWYHEGGLVVTLGGVSNTWNGRGHTTAVGRVPPVSVGSLELVSQSAAAKRTSTTPLPGGRVLG